MDKCILRNCSKYTIDSKNLHNFVKYTLYILDKEFSINYRVILTFFFYTIDFRRYK